MGDGLKLVDLFAAHEKRELAKKKFAKALDEMLPKMKPPTHTIYVNASLGMNLGTRSISATGIKPGTPPKEIVDLLKHPGIRDREKLNESMFFIWANEDGPFL